MGQLNCPVSGIGGYLRVPAVCGLFAGPRSLQCIFGPPQFCGLLQAPIVCGHPQFVGLKLCQFYWLIIDGRRALIQKIV